MNIKLRYFWLSLALLLLPSSLFAQGTTTPDTTPTPAAAPAATLAPLAEIPPSQQEMLKQKLLGEEVEEQDIQWLNAGTEKFLALWEPDTSGKPFGAVLMLHDDGQHPAWPKTVNPVRTYLSQYGWATLSISLPNTQDTPVPSRPAATPVPVKKDASQDDKNTPEAQSVHAKETAKLNAQDSEVDVLAQQKMNAANSGNVPSKPREDPEKITKERLDAAIKFMNDQGQFNIVVVAYGTSATRATRYISQLSGGTASKVNRNVVQKAKIQRPVRALVLVEARNKLTDADDSLLDYFTDSTMPVLDVFFGNHILDRIEAPARRKKAKQNGLESYFQEQMTFPSQSFFDGENPLSRRIRGFLNRYAKGVEVDKF